MNTDRVRAYLQVACAGLGFDIGEIWWSSNVEEGSSSALAQIEEKHEDQNALAVRSGKKMRFVQLYTSRSYEDRRNQLVTPADDDDTEGNSSGQTVDRRSGKKHVLSPLLVDAITKTAQVVWAHTKKQEGLTGRSDMRLQTAVGMPVAVDGNGNMCVVVMFSPNNIQSTDDAMEYLQSISRSATSASIPSLLPAFDPRQGLVSLPHHHATAESIPLLSSPNMADGSVITRFVSLDDAPIGAETMSVAEVHTSHDLVHAARDCFGIPMLPSVAIPDNATSDIYQGAPTSDAFDEASYGVWSTIMENDGQATDADGLLNELSGFPSNDDAPVPLAPTSESTVPVYAINKPSMEKERKDQLEEFAAAFLDVSVFDFAEVWVPIGEQADHLGQVTSLISTDSKNNLSLQEFQRSGEKILVKYWSGAVGRAFSSGNPVWSANQDVFVDGGRSNLFSKVKFETALAVPVFSGKSNTPAFVFCCYSFVPSGSVPFVLKFVQQALRLLWHGLDKVRPHKSIGEDLWRDVEPADLGEMAADVEMQQHFIIKKRPHASIEATPSTQDPTDAALAMGFKTLGAPSGPNAVRSIYTGQQSSPPSGPVEAPPDDEESRGWPMQIHHVQNIQTHIQQAVQSVGDMKPMHQHVSTNEQGSKRAHIFIERLDSPVEFDVSKSNRQTPAPAPKDSSSSQSVSPASHPLARPLPLPNSLLRQSSTSPSLPPQNMQTQQGQQSSNHQRNISFQQLPQAPVFVYTQQQQQQGQSPQVVYAQQQTSTFVQQHPQAHSGQPVIYVQQQSPILQSQPIVYAQQQQHTMSYVQEQQQPQTMVYAQQPQPVAYGQQQQQPQVVLVHQSQPIQSQQQDYGGQGQAGGEPAYEMYNMQQQQSTGESVGEYHQTTYSTQAQETNAPSSVSTTSYSTDTVKSTGFLYAPQNRAEGGNQVSMNGQNGAPNFNAAYCVPVGTQDNPTMANGNGNAKRCRIHGCNDPAVPRRPYCVLHSGNRMCEHAGCGKCAQGSTRFCIAHGGGRRCTFPGCDKGARDKFFCAAHGGGKRCKADGCNKSAVGGSSLCTAHGGGRRCCVEGCDKSAQSSTKFCVKHGGGKKCAHEDCDKVARGRTHFCAAHGGGVRCKLEGCNRVAIGKLQLCRAHGGGAKPRRPKGGVGKAVMPGSTGGVMLLVTKPSTTNESIPGFADMESV